MSGIHYDHPVEESKGAKLASVTFFTHGLCPYSQRVALVLAWKGIPHTTNEIDLSSKPGWYFRRTKTKLVPALEVAGQPYSESIDIARLLDKKFGPPHFRPLQPKATEHIAAVQALVRFAPQLERAGWALLGGKWTFPKSAELDDEGRAAWDDAVGTVEASLAEHGGPFLVGGAPCMADAVLGPFLARFVLAARRCRGFDARAASPPLAAYLDALDGDADWKATYPAPAPFGEAIAYYGRMDYFVSVTASLAAPLPEAAAAPAVAGAGPVPEHEAAVDQLAEQVEQLPLTATHGQARRSQPDA